ncbi:MAG TPA: cytochrome c biogenesis protein DipZ [Sporichthyaceae bacterium]|jgi:cytochrome c biogenesis protein CcdA/thiol-disulfide isomerase/thioredoxin|nr:cytochrome c biogenesis protein DipZ [Sporichthyaceae bacterium]
MLTTVLIGFLAGLITSISPCVLPMVPILLADPAAATDPAVPDAELASPFAATAAAASASVSVAVAAPPRRRVSVRRPLGIVAGLVLSFSLSTLFGSLVLDALGLPQDLLRHIGIAVLALIGVGLLSHRVSAVLERPFARLPRRAVNVRGNGVLLGLGMGLLFAPCAGPVLATIAVVGATHQFGVRTIALTFAFAIGAALPLLVLALARDAIFRRAGALRRHAARLRMAGGVVMIAMAMVLAFNWADPLQRHVPGYTAALQRKVEANNRAMARLHDLVDADAAKAAPAAFASNCAPGSSELQECGMAPEFTGVTAWLNTPGGRPLTMADLHGKVVLIDFWTYSCINCQRTLPYVEGWAKKYADAGLVVVGVHSPEFAFEHVRSNVTSEAAALGVNYPIAMDNDFGTWKAWANDYWPAEYLVDPTGEVRHASFGDGSYESTETLIRQMLAEAKPKSVLGSPLATDPEPITGGTPETYLGYSHSLPISGTAPDPQQDQAVQYQYSGRQYTETIALSGTWTIGREAMTAGPGAELRFDYQADKAYLVVGGDGTIDVAVDGVHVRTVAVHGVPTLYQLTDSPPKDGRGILTLKLGPGLEAYDFTFG